MFKWIVITIGKDPLFWAYSFPTRIEAEGFINSYINTFPQKFNYIIAENKKEIYDK